ncbi:DUF4123 domain-containing protein [Sphingomonas sp.]|uniref:DUF4123 domain-containing protein n=1 Tax=Sphingomonas sp. TaxID=28214 RepID=UPI003CC6C626
MSGWFAVIDTAQDERLHPLVEQCADRVCLLSGDLAPVLAAASPWLVTIDEREPLIGRWQEHGAGQNWGVLIETTLSLDGLRKHLRRFLQVMLPDGTQALFRFFDPRVFRIYLPAAPPEQQRQWFEEVRQFSVEGEDGAQHSFRWRGERLFDGDRPAVAA